MGGPTAHSGKLSNSGDRVFSSYAKTRAVDAAARSRRAFLKSMVMVRRNWRDLVKLQFIHE